MTKPKKSHLLSAEIAKLERRLFEAKAQYAITCGTAWEQLPDAGSKFHASGVILQISALGGREVIPPVMIRDGLSAKAIEALRDDVARSFEIATMVNPAMARGQ